MNPLNPKVNRRKFMGLLGGSCALIGAGGLLAADSADNRAADDGGLHPRGDRASVKRLPAGTLKEVTTEVLVVGGGMAGVFAAVKAHDGGAKVILVDKGAVGKSGQTPFARGIFRFAFTASPSPRRRTTASCSSRMGEPGTDR